MSDRSIIGAELNSLLGEPEKVSSSFSSPAPSGEDSAAGKSVPELAEEYSPNAFMALVRDLDEDKYQARQSAATKILNIAGYVEKRPTESLPGSTININFNHITSMAEALKGVSFERNCTPTAALAEPGPTPGANDTIHLDRDCEGGNRE